MTEERTKDQRGAGEPETAETAARQPDASAACPATRLRRQIDGAALYPATKAGRCSNGFERDRGRVVHAVPMDNPRNYNCGPALCGTEPGRLSAGWSHRPALVVNCLRCLRKLEDK